MNYTEFKEIMIEQIIKSFPEYEIKINKVNKNNNVELTAVNFIIPGAVGCPSVYLENLYNIYNTEKSFEKIIAQISESIKTPFNFIPQLESVFEFDKCKDLIKLRLINKDMNESTLKTVPHLLFMDLAIVCYCELNSGTFTVSDKMLNYWDVEAEELFEIAKKNMKKEKYKLFDAMSFEDFFIPDKSGFANFLSENKSKLGNAIMIAGTNICGVYGSNILLNDDYLDLIAEIFDESFYIIPSSVNECLFIKKSFTKSSDDLKRTLIAGNRNEFIVSKDEVLSDNIYFYNKSLNILSLV